MVDEINNIRNSRTSKMTLNYDVLGKLDLCKVYEQIQITIAKHIVADDKELLGKLRRNISSYSSLLAGKVATTRLDTLVIPIFLEFAYSIRFAVLMTGQGLLVHICDTFLFGKTREKEREPKMNPIVLAVIIATGEYLDKIVLNLESGT